MGGRGGAQQGFVANPNAAADQLDSTISGYLNGPEIKSILTPGEFCEWTFKLKAGQVLIAEARSEAFDPALEVCDSKAKVLESNDDRYPGDQRPLLLWRCESDGDFSLRARCFHDKSGGQVFVRYNIYNSYEVSADPLEQQVDNSTPFLLRMPMKAGEIKEVVSEMPNGNFNTFRVRQFIAESGLPDIGLSQRLQSITVNSVLVAPTLGNYYALAQAYGPMNSMGKIRASTRLVVPKNLEKSGGKWVGQSGSNTTSIWELTLKHGEFVQISTPDLGLNATLVAAEIPDFHKYDLAKPESNPFFPPLRNDSETATSYAELPSRARDPRFKCIYARRDTKLWICSNGVANANKNYDVTVKPAATSFAQDKSNQGRLRIGMTDYWSFDAKSGDVMTLTSSSAGFSPVVLVRDPEMFTIRDRQSNIDQPEEKWQMVVQKPGPYTLGISCLGDGGSGTYQLDRRVIHAETFGIGKPAKASISQGQVQVWKFTCTENEPLLIHWKSSHRNYTYNVYDDLGRILYIEDIPINNENSYGIVKVTEPHTFVIVLTGQGLNCDYSLTLSALKGIK